MTKQLTRLLIHGGPRDGGRLEKRGTSSYEDVPYFMHVHSPVFGDRLVYRYAQFGHTFSQEEKTVVLTVHFGYTGYWHDGKELTQDGEA